MSEAKILLTAAEVAALTGFSEGTIRHWTSQKKIPFLRISGRCVRYSRRDIESWLAEKLVSPAGNYIPVTHPQRGKNRNQIKENRS
jgi:excisionase family DNA binding protein